MKHLLTTILAASSVALAAAGNASAHATHGKWDTNVITMRASATSFPSNSSYRSSLGDARLRFLENPSKFWIDVQYNDTSVGVGNGQNEIWFTGAHTENPGRAYISYDFWNSNRIVEVDFTFSTHVQFTTSMSKTSLRAYGGAYASFEVGALYMFARAAGVAFEWDELNLMLLPHDARATYVTLNGSTCRSYLGEDVCDALVDTYGRRSGSSIEDVSATHWKHGWNETQQYYMPVLCEMFDSDQNTVLPSSSYNGQRRYLVYPGQTVFAQFTFENNGETAQSPRLGYYISTNSTISTSDTLVSELSLRLIRDSPDTANGPSIQIPSNLVPGRTYYLGVITNHDNRISEVTADNNQAYHIIEVGIRPRGR